MQYFKIIIVIIKKKKRFEERTIFFVFLVTSCDVFFLLPRLLSVLWTSYSNYEDFITKHELEGYIL